MNVQEYISSGILESFVLGELTEKESMAVMEYADQYPEIRKEIEKIEESLEALAFNLAVPPAPEVKENLLKNVADSTSEAGVVPMYPSTPRVWKLVSAASITIALIASFLAYNYWHKWQSTEGELTTLIAQNQQIADNYNQVNEKLNVIESNMKIYSNPAFRRVILKGTDNAPEALASVYWNDQNKQVYLSVQALKDLSNQYQYQLWAIIDGKPVDAGIFTPGNDQLIAMKDISGASAFAITIEKAGGSASPSLETMQVMGEVQ